MLALVGYMFLAVALVLIALAATFDGKVEDILLRAMLEEGPLPYSAMEDMIAFLGPLFAVTLILLAAMFIYRR